MKNKSVLILGAGLMQKPAILAAQKAGYYTVVIDADPAAVCVSLADLFVKIDLKNRPAIAELALKLKKTDGLTAVFTAGTDFSASVSYAAEQAGLPCHSFKAALNASEKTQMRACFAEAGVPSPAFFSVDRTMTLAEIRNKMKQLGLPCVIKPADNMGARGCRMIRTEQEVENAVHNALENSRGGHAILEQYMAGPEYSIDAIVYDGTMTITGFADRQIYYPPYFIETGHTMPTSCSPVHRAELIATFALGVKSLGLTCGAAKADIKYTAGGPMIGEIAARLSGGYMSGWTYPYASDCDLTAQALAVACGEKPVYLEEHRIPVPFTPPVSCCAAGAPFILYDLPCTKTCAERAYISIPGVVSSITGTENASAVPFIRDVLPRIKAGSSVDFPRNNVQKCGNVIACAPLYADAVSAAENACSLLVLRLLPHNDRTDAFLNGICLSDEKGFPPAAYDMQNVLSEITTGTIPAGIPVAAFIPAALLPLFGSNIRDWNYMTFAETIRRFDVLCPGHPELSAPLFWRAVIRGGIQGALYVADSTEGGGKK